jgi:uroporphyrinogen decarboxylase
MSTTGSAEVTALSKRERVRAALNGGEVDRPPVSAWWHDWDREWSAEGLAEATLESYRKYGWDYVKVNPRFCYYAEPWGTRFQHLPGRPPELAEAAVSDPSHLERIRALDGTSGAFGEQLQALKLIADGLQGEAPFIQTVFSPLAAMSFVTGSPVKYPRKLMQEHPDALLDALDAVTETLARYAAACLEAGADGIFLPTVDWGSADNISQEEYDRFAHPFDLRVLEAVRDAPFNVLHVCGDNNHLRHLLDYPVSAFHWDGRGSGNPALSEIAGMTEGAVMGGVSHRSTLVSGAPDAVTEEARSAVGETGGRRLLLAPGCSADPDSPDENLHALAEAARA